MAAILFRLKKYKKAVELYKDTLVLIAELYGGDKDKESDHASRIVEKLADTIQCQIEDEFRSNSQRSTPARVMSPRQTPPPRVQSPKNTPVSPPLQKFSPEEPMLPTPVQLANPQLNSFMMDMYPNSSAFLGPGVSPVQNNASYSMPPPIQTNSYHRNGYSKDVFDGGGPPPAPVSSGYQRQTSYTPPALGLDMRPASAPFQPSSGRGIPSTSINQTNQPVAQ